MSQSESKNSPGPLVNTGSSSPPFTRLLVACFAMWMDIQRRRFHVFILQQKLNNILVSFMRRRQKRLRFYHDLTNPKMYRLLEYVRSPNQFYKIFRVSLPAFIKIKEAVYEETSELSGWMPEIELLLLLFWLSAGSSNKKVSKLLGIHESLLHDIVHNVFEKFMKKISCVIQFPKGKIDYLREGFMKLASTRIFGLAVGCLDSYHIQINSNDLQYLNDSHYFSVQIQTLCDHKGSFMDIAVGFPGNMPKSQILQCTPLYLESVIPPPGYVLLSGSGYPCLLQPVCLIPPFYKNDVPIKKRFNYCHKKIHSVMKNSIGQMFDRWRRIFSKPLSLPLCDVTSLIITCSMIHNLCIEVNDIWPKEVSINFSVNNEYTMVLESQVCGKNTRKQMAKCLPSDSETQNTGEDFPLYSV